MKSYTVFMDEVKPVLSKKPLVAYTASLTSPNSPHQRADDHASALDKHAAVAMAQLWSGLSPISLALAWTDWGLHLLSSPGSQVRLGRQAVQHGMNWVKDSTQAAVQSFHTAGAPVTSKSTELPLQQQLDQDARFADPLWQQWPWRGLATANMALEQWWQEASGLRGMQMHSREQMRFYGRQLLDMYSPSNWLWTNPQALQAALASGGQTLLKGWQQAADDFRALQGLEPTEPRDDAPSPGRGLAMTPGQVVMRNGLVELIQYQPVTQQVHAEPVLIIPSCIMKYYILDLSPHNSMVRWLVGQGHTVYIVSWRNPDESDALLGMDDYVRDGVLAPLDHVHKTTGHSVHLVGYCLGGTFAAMAAAALGGGDASSQAMVASPIASLTLMAAETDFTEPGEMGVLIDEAQVRLLEDMMAARGFLTGKQMAGSFQFLHARELVWSSRTRRWLMGEDEIGNDLMAWNADVTRLPAVMHSQYLRGCFLRNDLAEGRQLFEGQAISLHDIHVPVFAVGTVKDHVAPWRSVYKIHRLVSADVTFALTSGGHNAGIVSEPGHAGRSYQLLHTAARQPWRTPEEWQAQAPRHEGSWWTAWSEWLQTHGSGHQIQAHPAPLDADLGPAPGQYVMVRYGD